MPVIIENNEDLKIVGLGSGKTRKTKPLIKKMFHNENLTGTGGKAGVQTEPAGVTAHAFHQENAIVAESCCLNSIDRIDGDLHGR